MKFSAELFTTDEFMSYDTKYEKEYDGAFYDVYMDYNGSFHMAIEDKASLLERVYFYNEYLSKGRYPVYMESSAELYENQRPEDIIAQVLGLPIDVMTKTRKNGDTYMLPVTEIIDRIHFEDGLYRGYGTLEGMLDENFLNSDHYSIIGAMNYLIENGIFLQNLERIYEPSRDDPSYFPIYVDERKIPDKYLNEPETGEKLFFDFFSHPLMTTKENYLATFGKVNGMTFSEKIAFAFENLDEKEDIMERELCIALRYYFFGICRSLINEFYQKEFHKTFLYSSVLDTAFECSNSVFGDFYIGPVFTMYRTKNYVLSMVDGHYVRQIAYSPYYCFEEDKKKIKLAFEGVKRFFSVHPKLSYLPMLFVKLMGLPYPAFEKVKYFDFERGTVNQFIELLYDDMIKYESPIQIGIVLPLYTPTGILIPYDMCQSYIPFYLNHFKSDIFYSEPALFSEKCMEDCLCFHGKTKESLSFFGGDCKLYDKLLEFDSKDEADIFQVVKDGAIEKGCYTLIRDYYRYMNDGYTAMEAANMLSIEDKIDPPIFAIGMLYLFYAYSYHKAESKIANIVRHVDYSRLPATPMVLFDENKDSHVYEMNRNFMTVIEDGRRKPFLSDKPEIDTMMKYFGEWIYRKDNRIFSCSAEGETIYYHKSYDYESAEIIAPAIYGKIEYSESINPLDNRELDEALSDIPEIRYERAFRKSLDYGIYLYGEDDVPRSLVVLKGGLLPKNISYLLSYDFLSVLCFGSQRSKSAVMHDPVLKNKLKQVWKWAFTGKNLCMLPEDTKQREIDYLFDYVGHFHKAWFEYLSGENDSVFFGCYKTKDKEGRDIYVAPGNTFSAFSYEEDMESFAFPSKDIPLMIEVINNVMAFAVSTHSMHNAEVATYQSGFPYFFYVALTKMLNRKERINEETLRRYFRFIDGDWGIDSIDVIQNHFFHKKTDIRCLSLPIEVRRSLLSDGLYCYPESEIHLMDIDDNPENPIMALQKPFELSDESRVGLLSKIKGIVKEYLCPDAILYENMVGKMMERCNKNKTKWNLFYVKEFLLCSYYEDHDIILKWIDAIQHHYVMSEKFFLLYQNMINRHTIFQGEDMVDSYTMFYYVFEFIVLIEQRIIITKRKKILEG